MSKILKNVAFGAGVGTVAGVAIHLLDKRSTDESDKPAIPHGVSVVLMAALAGLDPLFKAILTTAKGAIDQVLEHGTVGNDTDENEEDGDGNEHTPDAPVADATLGYASHPAGPGFAPTPA